MHRPVWHKQRESEFANGHFFPRSVGRGWDCSACGGRSWEKTHAQSWRRRWNSLSRELVACNGEFAENRNENQVNNAQYMVYFSVMKRVFKSRLFHSFHCVDTVNYVLYRQMGNWSETCTSTFTTAFVPNEHASERSYYCIGISRVRDIGRQVNPMN